MQKMKIGVLFIIGILILNSCSTGESKFDHINIGSVYFKDNPSDSYTKNNSDNEISYSDAVYLKINYNDSLYHQDNAMLWVGVNNYQSSDEYNNFKELHYESIGDTDGAYKENKSVDLENHYGTIKFYKNLDDNDNAYPTKVLLAIVNADETTDIYTADTFTLDMK
ncbi:MAG: hypothetical protein MJB14_19310 [Spirochaetes bacterium]|nr:hypothetical protein [Spirochaetota bacterium]